MSKLRQFPSGVSTQPNAPCVRGSTDFMGYSLVTLEARCASGSMTEVVEKLKAHLAHCQKHAEAIAHGSYPNLRKYCGMDA